MSALRQQDNYNGDGRSYCGFDNDQIERLISATQANGAKIDNLATQHNQVIRWLLIVVCIIALGAKLVEMARDIYGHNVVLKASHD